MRASRRTSSAQRSRRSSSGSARRRRSRRTRTRGNGHENCSRQSGPWRSTTSTKARRTRTFCSCAGVQGRTGRRKSHEIFCSLEWNDPNPSGEAKPYSRHSHPWARGRGIVEFRNERTWQNAVETTRTEEFHAAYEAAVDKVRADFGQKHPMIIGGQDVWATSTFEDTSPADTNLILGLFQKGGRPHSKHAIKAAKAAFPHWATTAYTDRVRLVQRAADLISERKFALSALMSFENGKNRYEAMADVDEAADLMRWYAAEMLRNQGYERAMGQFLPGETTRSILKPYGVWAVVAPFNFPLAIAAGMSTGALITGNTVVFKPASDTPFMGPRLAEILRDAGLPSGVFNYVTGPGATVGQELVDNADVDGFVFTGSRAVGIKALETFTRTRPKPIITEMGGKNPAIITASADLDKAAVGVMRAAFGYGGQKCSACSPRPLDPHLEKGVVAQPLSETQENKGGEPTRPRRVPGARIHQAPRPADAKAN